MRLLCATVAMHVENRLQFSLGATGPDAVPLLSERKKYGFPHGADVIFYIQSLWEPSRENLDAESEAGVVP